MSVLEFKHSPQTKWCLDLRAVAVVRILLGIGLLFDLYLRCQVLQAYYSEYGMVPAIGLGEQGFPNTIWSIHTLPTNYAELIILICIEAIVYISFTLGLFTKLSNIASLFLILSAQYRNVLVLNGADQLMRMLIFWLIFTPSGRLFSLDRLIFKRSVPNYISFIPSIALIIQVSSIYIFGAITKESREWWISGEAVYLAFQIDTLAKAPAVWLRQYPEILRYVNYFTVYTELLIGIAVWMRTQWRPAAIFLLLAGFCLHIGFFTFLIVGPFAYMNVVALIILTPSWVWDKVAVYVKVFRLNMSTIYSYRYSWLKLPVNGFVICCVIWISTKNLSSISWYPMQVPSPVEEWGYYIGLQQEWRFFAPKPPLDDLWPVLRFTLADGRVVNAIDTSLPADPLVKPKLISASWLNYKEQKLWANLADFQTFQMQSLAYHYSLWNKTHTGSQKVIFGQMMYVYETTTLPNEKAIPLMVRSVASLGNERKFKDLSKQYQYPER
ncbi:MAG: HTTM domain-containing protein [Bacteroidota bacterium]|nr:HTTM domain-containing protein [Bacteroidota bacterium]